MDPCCLGTVWEALWGRALILQQEASGERSYLTPRSPKWFSGRGIAPKKQDHQGWSRETLKPGMRSSGQLLADAVLGSSLGFCIYLKAIQ